MRDIKKLRLATSYVILCLHLLQHKIILNALDTNYETMMNNDIHPSLRANNNIKRLTR